MISSPSARGRFTHHQLQAAWHVARVVSVGGDTDTSLLRAYRSVASGGIHNSVSLAQGQLVLEQSNLLLRHEERLTATDALLRLSQLPRDAFVEALLFLRLTKIPELWLAALASSTRIPWEAVPEDVHAVLVSTFPNPGTREGFLLNAARKIDQEALARFGLEGEESVVRACVDYLTERGAAHLAQDVAHVSLTDDTLGYDVLAPDLTGVRHRLEVKATSAPPGWVDFYLSRNEATVGCRDPGWSLIVTRRVTDTSGESAMHVAGWLDFSQFDGLLPIDREPAPDHIGYGRWDSCRISLADHLLQPGIPLGQKTMTSRGDAGRRHP